MRFLKFAVCLALGAAVSGPVLAGDYRIVGYAGRIDASQLKDLGKIDTLIYAFAHPHDGKVVLDGDDAAHLQALIALKTQQPKLKVVISVGGWSVGGFSEAASTPASRQLFADSAAQLVAAQHADGLDVDWEYPGHHESGITSSPDDKRNYTLLLQALRKALDRAGGKQHLSLSVAIADGPFVSDIDIAAINPSLDWFNLMTYDFVNAMTPTTGHHTGLYASKLITGDKRTTDASVKQFLAAGVAPHKLVIGAAWYGRQFEGVADAEHGLYQKYAKFQAMLPWPQLVAQYINKNGYVRYWDAQAQAPWLWNAKEHRFISYDDPQSIAAKAAYVKAHQLGGIMYWEQSLDPSDTLLDAAWQGLQP